MVIYNKHNYLPNLYKNLPGDEVSRFLKDHHCHLNFLETKNYIESLILEKLTLDILVNYFYSKIHKNVFKRCDILENIYQVNYNQYKKLKESNFKINYNSTGRFDYSTGKFKEKVGKVNTAILNPGIVDIKKRTLVIYFRGPWRDLENTAAMDIFHTILIYKIIEKYIDNNNLKYFNNVLIVRAAPHHEKFKIFDDLDLNHSSETGDNFITHTCLYSNTLHFNGGSLPDLAAHTIPIISKQFIHFNNSNIQDADKDLVIDAIYPEVQYKDNLKYYCKDPESFYDGKVSCWYNICSCKENIKIIKNCSTSNLLSLVTDVMSNIYKLESKIENG